MEQTCQDGDKSRRWQLIQKKVREVKPSCERTETSSVGREEKRIEKKVHEKEGKRKRKRKRRKSE